MRYLAQMTSTLALATALGGCPADDTDEPTGDRPFAPVQCARDLPEMRIGMTATGASGRIRAELLDADHVPVELFHNNWTVRFTSSDGEELDDVVIDEAKPWMPAHRHDGKQRPAVTALEEPGVFQVDRLNLWMEGPWEIQLQVRSASLGSDLVIFYVCLEEERPDGGQ